MACGMVCAGGCRGGLPWGGLLFGGWVPVPAPTHRTGHRRGLATVAGPVRTSCWRPPTPDVRPPLLLADRDSVDETPRLSAGLGEQPRSRRPSTALEAHHVDVVAHERGTEGHVTRPGHRGGPPAAGSQRRPWFRPRRTATTPPSGAPASRTRPGELSPVPKSPIFSARSAPTSSGAPRSVRDRPATGPAPTPAPGGTVGRGSSTARRPVFNSPCRVSHGRWFAASRIEATGPGERRHRGQQHPTLAQPSPFPKRVDARSCGPGGGWSEAPRGPRSREGRQQEAGPSVRRGRLAAARTAGPPAGHPTGSGSRRLTRRGGARVPARPRPRTRSRAGRRRSPGSCTGRARTWPTPSSRRSPG